MKVINKLKYFLNRFNWMRIYNSPFKRPIMKWYFGKITIGTPYFLPRRWIKNKEKPGYKKAIPRKIGFDFVPLGWKTKWDEYRFEWNPVWSFVFFKWQIAVTFCPYYKNKHHSDQFWECWLVYHNKTDKTKSVKERIKQAKEINPCIWSSYVKGEKKETIHYWDIILKEKY